MPVENNAQEQQTDSQPEPSNGESTEFSCLMEDAPSVPPHRSVGRDSLIMPDAPQPQPTSSGMDQK